MDPVTVFNQINAKLWGAIMKPKNFKYKFLFFWFQISSSKKNTGQEICKADMYNVAEIKFQLDFKESEMICHCECTAAKQPPYHSSCTTHRLTVISLTFPNPCRGLP